MLLSHQQNYTINQKSQETTQKVNNKSYNWPHWNEIWPLIVTHHIKLKTKEYDSSRQGADKTHADTRPTIADLIYRFYGVNLYK